MKNKKHYTEEEIFEILEIPKEKSKKKDKNGINNNNNKGVKENKKNKNISSKENPNKIILNKLINNQNDIIKKRLPDKKYIIENIIIMFEIFTI